MPEPRRIGYPIFVTHPRKSKWPGATLPWCAFSDGVERVELARLWKGGAARPAGQPQGRRAAHQGDSEPHALLGHDRWRELPRPPYAPFYGARHDRSCVPRSPAPDGSLAGRRAVGWRGKLVVVRPPLAKEEHEEESPGFASSRHRRFLRSCGLRTGGRRRSAPAGRREGRAGQTAGEGRGQKGEAKVRAGRTESQKEDRARSEESEKASGREGGYTALSIPADRP